MNRILHLAQSRPNHPGSMKRFAITVLLLATLSLPAPAFGLETETSDSPTKQQLVHEKAPDSATGMRLGIKGGVSAFLNSQSYRPAHFIKPTTRVEFATGLSNHREVGLELVGTRSENDNYSLVGAMAFARAPMYVGTRYGLHFRGGFGLGSGPRVLFKDLSYEKALIPWGQFGFDMNWKILPGLRLGTAILNENLSVLSVLLTLDFDV